MQRQAEELAARQRVTQSILRSTELEERLHVALEEILALLALGAGEPSDRPLRGAIYLVENERLVLRVQRGFSETFLALARDVPLDACSWVDTWTVSDAPWEGADPITQALQKEGVMAWTSLPLLVGEQLEGILLLADRRAAALEREALQSLLALGEQVAVALHNARLYAQRGNISIHKW